ncbi:MAG: 16S rRNA (cytosine(1402)-N(4))-methyltransferase RsmH [Pirellulales bacterium]|nr:16S rRNA (cytosine(1402)-N(4))-methyltransferase RsmH [Pirellulales bacterium]
MSEHSPVHVPVMPNEIMEWLDPKPGGVFVDGTLGGGGHASLLAERVGETGTVIGIDRDPAAIEAAEYNLSGMPMHVAQGNYCNVPEFLEALDFETVDGILLDLGLSSDQLADPKRGFSFSSDGPLDLRFDTTSGEPTWRWINRISADKLADLIFQYGEERFSRRIARAIVEQRRKGPIRTTAEMADIVRRNIPNTKSKDHIDPATRTFQALRIASNEELKSLEIALRRLPTCLSPGGRLAIISFHSLEDRRVKETFRDDPRLKVLTKKPVRPSEEEIEQNPRCRSAKLRVAARV